MLSPTSPPRRIAVAAAFVGLLGVSGAAAALAAAAVGGDGSAATATITTSPAERTFVITGHGYGHGVGLSQWGAEGYALHGWSYARILRHYYTGTTIVRRPPTTLRVLLADGAQSVSLTSTARWHVVDGGGRRVGLQPGTLTLGTDLRVHGHALVSPLTFVPSSTPLALGTALYRGELTVTSRDGTLQVVNDVGIEPYLDGVIGGEMPPSWSATALEAQAIAARTYALVEVAAAPPGATYDLYSDTRSQVYGGVEAESPEVASAVAATAGEVVLAGGSLAKTYFFASSGGRTDSAADAFGTPLRYLVSVPDPYDSASPYHDWAPMLLDPVSTARELGLSSPVVDLQVTTDAAKRVSTVSVTTATGGTVVPASTVVEALGLRSSWFEIGVLALDQRSLTVAGGQPATLSGVARGLGHVTIEGRGSDGVWETVGVVRPNSNGAFSFPVEPTATTIYRLASGTVRAGAVEVRVRPTITATAGPVGVSGTVRPALQPSRAELQLRHGPVWRTIATGPVGRTGSFHIRSRLSGRTYRVRYAPAGLAPTHVRLLLKP